MKPEPVQNQKNKLINFPTIYFSTSFGDNPISLSFKIIYTQNGLRYFGFYLQNNDETIDTSIYIRNFVAKFEIEYQNHLYDGWESYADINKNIRLKVEIDKEKLEGWKKEYLQMLDYYYNKYNNDEDNNELEYPDNHNAENLLEELLDSILPIFETEDDINKYFDDGIKFVQKLFSYIKKMLKEVEIKEISTE